MTKKSRNFIQNRNDIIELTIDLIAIKSVASVSMRDIAKAASVDTSTLYYYFKNKEDLMFQITIHINEKMQEALLKLDLSNFNSDEETFKYLVRFVYDYLSKKPSHASTMRQMSVMGNLILSKAIMDEVLDITVQNLVVMDFFKQMEAKYPTMKTLGLTCTLFCYMPIYDLVMHTYFPHTVTEEQINTYINSLWNSIKDCSKD
ncbi:MAG: TetR/AcrR family transcriptional regulator [Deferribacterales bacterium]